MERSTRPDRTEHNLLRTHQAIWCSPPGLTPWPSTPVLAGERLWLVWRGAASDAPIVLGGGLLLSAPRTLYGTTLLWTDPDLPGMRSEALRHGYGGPTSMSFLRLSRVALGRKPFQSGGRLGHVSGGLNLAEPEMVDTLSALLPVPSDT